MTLSKQTIEDAIDEILDNPDIDGYSLDKTKSLSLLFIQMCEEILPKEVKINTDDTYLHAKGLGFNEAIQKMRAELEKLKGK